MEVRLIKHEGKEITLSVSLDDDNTDLFQVNINKPILLGLDLAQLMKRIKILTQLKLPTKN